MTVYELPPAWMLDGLCRQVDPDLWFPEASDPWAVQRAKQTCQTCPVAAECAQYAIDRYEPYGVWGGMTAKERTEYRRRHGINKPRATRTCNYCSTPFYPRNYQHAYCRALCKKRAYESKQRPNPHNQRH